jgi:CheY-like chemotaxis protein
VSHELRTPLNAILGWTTIARSKAPPELERALAIVERNARAQARIIEDVLDISRIVRGRLSLERKVTPAQEPLAAAVESVRAAAESKGIELVVELGNLGACEADAERIQQVAWNLLSNGIKFTQKGGRVTIRASRVRERITVRVTDTGQGIDPAFLPHIFEPFRQGDGSTTRRHGGLGLGLAIVRKLVDAHGGVVYAESDGVGKGSTFTIELPIAVERESRPPPRFDGAGAARRLDGVKVVIVDDEDDARALLCHVLGSRGATVVAASTVDEALARVEAQGVDVVVSDIGMPNADGYSLVRRLRLLPPERGGRTPAIALTAYARTEDRDEALAAGFQRHVPKPVDLDALAHAVAELAQEGPS